MSEHLASSSSSAINDLNALKALSLEHPLLTSEDDVKPMPGNVSCMEITDPPAENPDDNRAPKRQRVGAFINKAKRVKARRQRRDRQRFIRAVHDAHGQHQEPEVLPPPDVNNVDIYQGQQPDNHQGYDQAPNVNDVYHDHGLDALYDQAPNTDILSRLRFFLENALMLIRALEDEQ